MNVVARWQSKGGKYWCRLHKGAASVQVGSPRYWYTSNAGTRDLGRIGEKAAIDYVTKHVITRWPSKAYRKDKGVS